jgi:hypothetical protein
MTTTTKLLELAAAYRRKADALELAAQELNGHHTVRKQAQAETALDAAIALRRTQKRTQAPTPKRTPSYRVRKAEGRERARFYATLLQEHGPLSAKALSKLAREHGKAGGITGILGYVKAGYLSMVKVRGKPKGEDRVYGFKAMPPEPEASRG